MGALGFTNAVFLIGLAGAAIPLIIHLIHRRRAPRVPFSTLRFLYVSSRRTARRRRLENLLILLLRMAMIAVVALACAGPFLRSGLLGAGGAGGGVVIVLDNSLSMSAREQGTTRYGLAREAAETILGDLGEQDLCVVLLAASGPEEEPPRLTDDVEDLRHRIATSEPTAAAADLPRTLARAEALLDEAGLARREVYVLTDMQARSWEGASTEPSAGAEPTLPVVVLDCSATEVRNLALGKVAVLARAMVAGAPLTVQATVRNGSPRNEQEMVELFIGEEKRGSRSVTLAPHEEKPVQFTFSLEQPGSYWGRLSLRGDDLPGDDLAYFTVRLTGAVPALLVKEVAHPIDFLDDTFFLSQALNPFAGETVASPTGIDPEVVTLAQLTPERLRRYPVTFLVNVGNLSEAQGRMLRDYVAAGNGLVIFLGDRVDADRYNALLGETEDGDEALLPADLSAPRGDAEGRVQFSRVEEVADDHALFAPFRTSPSAFFSQVHVYRFFPAKVSAGGGRVLASLAGGVGEGLPFLVERNYGQGRCLLIVTSATTSWSNFPVTSLFLPLMSTAVHYLVGEARQIAPLRPGVPKRFITPAAEGRVSVDVTDPTGRTTEVAPTATGELIYRDTYRPGIYRYSTSGPPPETGYFAVNPEPEESELRRIDPQALAERFPRYDLRLAASPEELKAVMTRLHQPYQLGAVFFWLLLVVAAVEGVLANRISANLQAGKGRV